MVETTEVPYFGRVTCYGRLPKIDRSENVLIGYSVRNTKFSKKFFVKALNFIQSNARKGIIVMFDYPYAFNDAADRGDEFPVTSDFEKNKAIGDERVRMIEKVIASEDIQNVEIRRWEDFSENADVKGLRHELIEAISESDSLRLGLLENAVMWLRKYGMVGSEYFLNFQTQEIPLLTYLYYCKNYLLDIYPGQNFSIFEEIERGMWSDVLPLATSCAASKKLCFIDVS